MHKLSIKIKLCVLYQKHIWCWKINWIFNQVWCWHVHGIGNGGILSTVERLLEQVSRITARNSRA